MREKIVIRLPSHPEEPVRWIEQGADHRADHSVDEAAPIQEQVGSLEEIAQIASGAQVTLLAPAMETLLTEAELPPVKASRLQQIVGYALEETLSEEVSRIHFAVGRRTPDGEVPVAAIRRSFMEEWFSAIRTSGLRVHEMLPEALSIPISEDEWTLLVEGDQGVLRTGESHGFALDLSEFEAIFALTWEQTEASQRPERLRLYSFEPLPEALFDPDTLPDGVTLEVEACDHESSPLQLMLSTLKTAAPTINLLSGDYSLHREFRKLWLPWREAAILVGAFLAIQLIFSIAQLHHHDRLNSAFLEEQHQLFRDTLPEVSTIRFPRRQMEARLQELYKNQTVHTADFIEFFAPAAVVIDTPSIELQSVSYRSGVLDLSLLTPDLSSLEAVKTRFDQMEALEVELRSVVTGKNRAEGTIRLRRRA